MIEIRIEPTNGNWFEEVELEYVPSVGDTIVLHGDMEYEVVSVAHTPNDDDQDVFITVE